MLLEIFFIYKILIYKFFNFSRPNVGDLICGQRFDGDWLRGYILSLTPPLKMVIIDEARIMPINKTVTCDKTFSNIYAFGAICEITDTKHKFKV